MNTGETGLALQEIWAKSPAGRDKQGQPLLEHTLQVLRQAGQFITLYRREIESVKDIDLKRVLLYAALVHDFGKIHPGFQEQLRSGRPFGLRHEILSLAFLRPLQVPEQEAGYLAAAVALHHKDWQVLLEGTAASPAYFQPGIPFESHYPLVELSKGIAEAHIKALLKLLAGAGELIRETTGLVVSPYGFLPGRFDLPEAIFEALEKAHRLINSFGKKAGRRRQAEIDKNALYNGVLARGLLISADHLASAGAMEITPGFACIDDVLTTLRLEKDILWPHQREICETSGSAVLVAPTGSGKTESALLWAGKVRSDTGSRGRVYLLLPYRASMNAMADRLGRDFGNSSIALIHGKSLNRIYEKLLEQGYTARDAVTAARYREALARLNTAPIRVCSPYQLIRSFLGQKGYEASLCGALGAQLVFDEIHAYDTTITAMAIVTAKFLSENLHARVLFMTATLPGHLMKILNECFPGLPAPVRPPEAWLAGKIRHRLKLLPYHALSVEAIKEIKKAAEKGAVLVVLNRVSRAVRLASELRRSFPGEVVLLHSRFCQRDRSEIEKKICPRPGEILVATQVVEVSLDIDYDTGFFEIAPLESLLQRCGRVNRRGLKPPAAVNIFTEFDEPLEKAAWPYHAGHLEQVNKVLQDFLKWRPDGTWSELVAQELLDSSYPETLKNALTNDFMEVAGEFEKCFAKTLRPFGVMDFNQIKELQEQWDKLFDGCAVLPGSLLAEALECPTPLDVAQLLVPVPGGQFKRLKREGKLYWHDDIKEYVTVCDYDHGLGLLI